MPQANKTGKRTGSRGASRSAPARAPDKPKRAGARGEVEIPEILRSDVQIRADTIDEDARTVEIVWAAGAPVQRYDYWEGESYIEELSMDPTHIRMERFASGMSLLDSHSPYSMDDRLGVVLPGSVRIEGGLGIATVQFSRKQRAEELFQDVRDGMPFPVSVGYKTHAYTRTDANENSIARLTATDWEPMELSAVPIPADPAAHSRSEEASTPHVKVAVSRRAGENDMPQGNRTGRRPASENNPGRRAEGEDTVAAGGDDTVAGGEDQTDDEGDEDQVDDTITGGASEERAAARRQQQTRDRVRGAVPAPVSDAAVTTATIAAEVARQVAVERARSTEIGLIGRRAGMDATAIDAAIQGNTTVADFRAMAFEAMATRQESAPSFPHSPGRVSAENRDARRDGVTNALLHRYNPGGVQLSEVGRNYRGLKMLEIAREMLREDGVDVRGLTPGEIAQRAFHSTSDFPIILQNVIRGSLRAAYEAYPQTFAEIGRRTTAPDFKEMKTIQLSEGPRLLKVNEHGEYKRGTLRESEQAYSIATYGRIVGVTRQLLINDDLGAFTRIPQLYGASIAQLESDLVWFTIVSNMVMADGNALFSNAHGNIDTPKLFSAQALGDLRQLMSQQKGMDGQTRLSLRPKYLLVGTKLEYLAEQILSPNSTIYPQQPGGVIPESLRRFQLIVEPRLDDMGTGANQGWGFILAADPAQIDTIEYAYLEGQEGAYMETKEGWDVDGMEVKCRLDFGATVIDSKGLAYNPGLAPS